MHNIYISYYMPRFFELVWYCFKVFITKHLMYHSNLFTSLTPQLVILNKLYVINETQHRIRIYT